MSATPVATSSVSQSSAQQHQGIFSLCAMRLNGLGKWFGVLEPVADALSITIDVQGVYAEHL
jgi:hypothetical protein